MFQEYLVNAMHSPDTTQAPSAGSLESSPWPYIAYFLIAFVTTPLYIAILVQLYQNRSMARFSNLFYTLVLSQGVADVLYVICYTIFFALSYVGTIKDIDKFFKWTTANWSYKSIYYCLSLRCVGVTFISFQRYIAICKWQSKTNQIISTIPRRVIVFAHWIISFLLIIPILTIGSIRFGCVCKQMVAIDADDLMLSTINSEVIVMTTFPVCLVCYTCTVRHVYAHKASKIDLNRNMRLCIPVAALIFSLFLIFLYHLIQLFSIGIHNEQHRAVRVLEPLFIGFLSFFTPWMLLISSREIASLIKVKFLWALRAQKAEHGAGTSVNRDFNIPPTRNSCKIFLSQ